MSSEIESFHPVDYLVFALNLVISLGIGLYVGYGQRKASSQGGAQGGGTAQYHTAELNLIPVACSMVMSYISGLIVLGNTAEMYLNGVQNWLACIGSSIAFMFSALVLVPFFHPMKLTSSFEYLERRFESVVIRVWASILFMISSIIYMGLSLYTPATALEAVTEFPAWASISVCGVVCMIYTSLGGVKAVIWTDTVQGSILIIGVIVVVVGGAIEVGGLGEIFDIASEGERMKMFNFSFNPTIRLTFWSLMVGRFFISLNYVGTGQISIQRFSSLKSLKDAQWSAILNIPAIIIIYTLTCLGGLTVYAYYAAKGCDPLANGDISSSNQLMPYFIMETLHYPGVPGIFLAVLFSGALSSLSSSLNSCAACLWKDILALKLAHITDNRKMIINKFCVLLFGAAGVGMAFISEQLGGHVLQASQSLIGASGGPSTGLFLLGAFFPCSNKWGALFGSIIGFIMSAWMSLGGYIAELPWSSLPTSTENCTTSSTDIYHSMYSAARSNLMATTAGYEEEDNEVFAYYRVSFMYASMWGCLVTIFTGLLISFATGSTNPRTLDPMLTVPVFDRLCCCLPARWRRPCWCGVQHDQYDQEKASHECDGKKNSLEMIDSSTKYNGDLKHESEVDLKEDWNSYIEVVKM